MTYFSGAVVSYSRSLARADRSVSKPVRPSNALSVACMFELGGSGLAEVPLGPRGGSGSGSVGPDLAAVDVLSSRGCIGGAGLAGVGGVPDTHDERPPRRPWPQDTMRQNEGDARPRDQDGKPLQQFEGIEQEVRGAIRPRVPELQHHPPLDRQLEPVLRDGRPQRVPAEPIEAVPLVGRDPHAGIEIEPLLAGVTAPGSGNLVLANLVATLM